MGLFKRLKTALFPPKIPKCICGSPQQKDKVVYSSDTGQIFRLAVLTCMREGCPIITVLDTPESRAFTQELINGNIPEFDKLIPKGVSRWWTQ